MQIDDLTIGQARELAGMFSGTPPATAEKDCGVRIVILQRGHIAVGHVYTAADEVRIENAAIVRRWGTTNGLGELAKQGPLSETILDDCPTLHAHPLTVVGMMEVEANAWNDRR